MTRVDERWFLEIMLLAALAMVVGALLSLLALWCVVRHPTLTAWSAAALVATAVGARLALRVAGPARLPSS